MECDFYQSDDQESGGNKQRQSSGSVITISTPRPLIYTLDKLSPNHLPTQRRLVPRVKAFGRPRQSTSLTMISVNLRQPTHPEGSQITPPWNRHADFTEYNKIIDRIYKRPGARAERGLHKAVKGRITLASKISPRPADELREEERHHYLPPTHPGDAPAERLWQQ